MRILLFSFILFSFYVSQILTCNGVGVAFPLLKNCDSKNVIKLNRVNITLSDDCVLQSTGSREITKNYNAAQILIKTDKSNGRRMQTRINACQTVSNPIVTKVLNLLAIPNSCPVTKGKKNLNTKEDLTNMKGTLPFLLGSTHITVNIEHDNGISCFEGNYTLYKK